MSLLFDNVVFRESNSSYCLMDKCITNSKKSVSNGFCHLLGEYTKNYFHPKLSAIALVALCAINVPRYAIGSILEFSGRIIKLEIKDAFKALSKGLIKSFQNLKISICVFSILIVSLIWFRVFAKFSIREPVSNIKPRVENIQGESKREAETFTGESKTEVKTILIETVESEKEKQKRLHLEELQDLLNSRNKRIEELEKLNTDLVLKKKTRLNLSGTESPPSPSTESPPSDPDDFCSVSTSIACSPAFALLPPPGMSIIK